MASSTESRERADMRRWVETWKQAGPELAAIRRAEIRTADNVHVMELLGEAYNQALSQPSRTSSGLVEMQRLFALTRSEPAAQSSGE